MKKNYSNDELNNINKLVKKVIIINLFIVLASLGLLVYLIIIASREYTNLFKALLTIDLFILGSSVFACFFMFYRPLYILYRHINNIVSANSTKMIIRVVKITPLTTISSNIRVYGIECKSEDKDHILYLNPDFNDISFNEEDLLEVEISSNFIKTYEVLKNE